MSLTDESLVSKIKTGDYNSFEELVKRYERRVYNIVYRILGNDEDAGDVMQEVFLTVFQKIKSFKGKSKFYTWLYRVAVNMALMKLRSGGRQKTLSLDVPLLSKNAEEIRREIRDDWSENPLATLENMELRNLLTELIGNLPEDYRTVFMLRDVNKLTAEEVAGVLNISIPAVKSRLHRARLFLRDKLSDYFKGIMSKDL